MWYNAENLFYPEDDSIDGDDGFTPGGERRWTWERYRKKLTDLAKVIVAAGAWNPPDVVGLAEIEDSRVLEDLISHPLLTTYRYSYIHREGKDHRGMEVACMFRGDRLDLCQWRTIPPVGSGEMARTRSFIHLTFSWGARDTLDLFLVHLISKYRGEGSTASYRRTQSAWLLQAADSARIMFPGRMVVMAGDFNESWGGYSLAPMITDRKGGDTIQCFPDPAAGQSYKYRGSWLGIDMFLVMGHSAKYRLKGSVFRHPAMSIRDHKYGGTRPFRTYEGYRYTGGFSDHLPILLDINRSTFRGVVSR
jgi:endonuclease/exonuclease/phosphatase family metal-dependent hydrolase